MKECYILRFWMDDSFRGEVEAEGHGVRERIEIGDIAKPYEDVEVAIDEGIDRLSQDGWVISEDVIVTFSQNFFDFWRRVSVFGKFVAELRAIDEESEAVEIVQRVILDPVYDRSDERAFRPSLN